MARDYGMSFFDYPTPAPEDADSAPAADVLLPEASEADWTTILEFTRAAWFAGGAWVGLLFFSPAPPRSMSVRAVTAAALAEMNHGDFASLFAAHPDLGRRLLMDLGRILAGRLRRAEAGGRAAYTGARP